MSVVYSLGAKFGGGGIGRPAYQQAASLWRHGLLQHIYCGTAVDTEIPSSKITTWGWPSRLLRKTAVYDHTHLALTYHHRYFDRWVQRRLSQHHLFIFWNGFGLESMQQARQYGAATMVVRASSHPAHQAALLAEEHRLWGRPFSSPVKLRKRSLAEIEAADYVLIPSAFVRQSCLEAGVPAAKLIEIPFGVDRYKFMPVVDKPKDATFRVLFVGQIGLRKGALYLLQAWQRLRWRQAELWLLGMVNQEIRPFLAPFRSDPSIHFLNHTPDPAHLYQQADLFVFPSIEEGSALVTYEAMASGLPVITTPNAGSLVRDGQDGFLVPIRNVEKMAAAMETLRANDALRRQMGQSARRHIEAFTWAKHGAQLAQTVKRLLVT